MSVCKNLIWESWQMLWNCVFLRQFCLLSYVLWDRLYFQMWRRVLVYNTAVHAPLKYVTYEFFSEILSWGLIKLSGHPLFRVFWEHYIEPGCTLKVNKLIKRMLNIFFMHYDIIVWYIYCKSNLPVLILACCLWTFSLWSSTANWVRASIEV